MFAGGDGDERSRDSSRCLALTVLPPAGNVLVDAQGTGVLEADAHGREGSDDAFRPGPFTVPADDVAGGIDDADVPAGAHRAERPDNMGRPMVSLALLKGAGQVAVDLNSADRTDTG